MEPVPTPIIISSIINIILTAFYTFIWVAIVMGLSCLITPLPAVIVCGIAILIIRKKFKLFV